ncbi:uncharacterized protein LOC131163041 [Malania oleifera]|uniref:uncharacterized protein LOC131163041 n=1 Tax=Malania oleifera TaxID=397392 RepID=UPI0025AE5861|nr:uncharacterized protein LOC131163041 [Malania oleifera]
MAKWWRAVAGGLRTVARSPRPSSSSLSTSSPSAAYHTIQAVPRELTGSRVSARDRAQGRIPAVVFTQEYIQKNSTGGGTDVVASACVSRKHLITTERKQIQSILKSVEPDFFCSTTFKLQIRAGSGSSVLLQSGTVLPIKVHKDRETGMIMNLVFAWAEEGSELKVDVPVVFKGEDVCPGLKKGGHLNRIRMSLKYLCPAEHIPAKIEVDVSNLDIEDRVFMRDVKVHPSLKLLSKNEDMPVCKIVATCLGSSEPAQLKA